MCINIINEEILLLLLMCNVCINVLLMKILLLMKY